MTDEIRADAKTLAERQYFFIKEHIRVIDYHFISLLDTPLGPDNPMTLRRAMMARAPKDRHTSRLIHNVDQSWNSTSRYMVTTVVGREEEANRFLANLIPELLYIHGPEASNWFSGQGLSVYKDVRWNPKKGTTSSSNARDSAAMVDEDVWDLGEKWKTLTVASADKTSQRPDTAVLDGKKKTPKGTKPNSATEDEAETSAKLSERLAGDKSVASFGGAFGRATDSDDEKEAEVKAAYEAAHPPDMTGTKFIFSPDQVDRENEKAEQGIESDGLSMSTAGKTTDGTRLKLKIAQEEIAALKLSIQSQNNPSMVPLPRDDTDMESDTHSEMDTEQHTDAQVLGAALAAPKREAIHPDNDAMEEDEHNVVYIGDDPSMYNVVYHGNDHSQDESQDEDEESRQATILADAQDTSTAADSFEDPHSIEFIGSDPSQTSASDPSQSSASNQDPSQSSASSSDQTSSSSSSSSAQSHDTAKLVQRITKLTSPKSLIKIDRPGGSTDSASRQSSGQDSGSSKDHIPEDSSGKAGVVLDDAGQGE
jgi:hypothetical protein